MAASAIAEARTLALRWSAGPVTCAMRPVRARRDAHAHALPSASSPTMEASLVLRGRERVDDRYRHVHARARLGAATGDDDAFDPLPDQSAEVMRLADGSSRLSQSRTRMSAAASAFSAPSISGMLNRPIESPVNTPTRCVRPEARDRPTPFDDETERIRRIADPLPCDRPQLPRPVQGLGHRTGGDAREPSDVIDRRHVACSVRPSQRKIFPCVVGNAIQDLHQALVPACSATVFRRAGASTTRKGR